MPCLAAVVTELSLLHRKKLHFFLCGRHVTFQFQQALRQQTLQIF